MKEILETIRAQYIYKESYLSILPELGPQQLITNYVLGSSFIDVQKTYWTAETLYNAAGELSGFCLMPDGCIFICAKHCKFCKILSSTGEVLKSFTAPWSMHWYAEISAAVVGLDASIYVIDDNKPSLFIIDSSTTSVTEKKIDLPDFQARLIAINRDGTLIIGAQRFQGYFTLEQFAADGTHRGGLAGQGYFEYNYDGDPSALSRLVVNPLTGDIAVIAYGRVRLCSSDGVFIKEVNLGHNFGSANCIAFDAAGTLVISSSSAIGIVDTERNHVIRSFGNDQTITHLQIDQNGSIIVAEKSGRITRWSTS